MKNIKLIICDIDGTILPAGHDDISLNLQQALKQLKKSGYDILIATGRHYKFVPEKLLQHFDNDCIVTINGACINKSNGEVVDYHPLQLEDLMKVIELCEANDIALGLKFKDNIVTYNLHQKFIDNYLKDPIQKAKIIDCCQARDYHLAHDLPLGIFLIGDPATITGFQAKLPNLVVAQSTKKGFDVFDKNVTKAYGIEKYLKMKGYAWDECMAFGDAENDITMLKKAAVAVTFENVKPVVQAAANYITVPCIDDGVYKALKHFKMI
ncbi:MAG: Cof-type HAD-IIB family hydrolase [Erysipelotrichaceae bacterium]|nr:Cof-type HAD-IIB family hydrolase [Erysipelotrichaceae bacterium]MDY5251659.1 HAD family hydrolase [Erysipelotrichaceae bacterium]